MGWSSLSKRNRTSQVCGVWGIRKVWSRNWRVHLQGRLYRSSLWSFEMSIGLSQGYTWKFCWGSLKCPPPPTSYFFPPLWFQNAFLHLSFEQLPCSGHGICRTLNEAAIHRPYHEHNRADAFDGTVRLEGESSPYKLGRQDWDDGDRIQGCICDEGWEG